MGLSFKERGDFRKTEKFLKKALGRKYRTILEKYGEYGVQALSANTPVDTGLLASSWYYTIEQKGSSISVVWSNRDIEGGYNIALLLQMGHGTGNGGYVKGVDYINPALEPIFQSLADAAWKEVTTV